MKELSLKNAPQLVLYLATVFGGEVKGDRMLLPFSLPDGKFVVHSIAPKQGITHNRYLVSIDGENWYCSCPHHQFQRVECKHIDVVRSNVMSINPEPTFLKDWQSIFQ
jgi:hypothetical protein